MNYLNSDKVVMFDVDDTLVLWDDGVSYSKREFRYKPELGLKAFRDPYYGASGRPYFYLKPNEPVIQLLKDMKTKEDRTIVVWSAGGAAWAKIVVDTLKLEEYVDLVMSKPTIYVDDLPCQEFMLHRINPETLKKESKK